MIVERDLDQILAAWLEEGPAELPARTRHAVLATLVSTPQARRRRFRLLRSGGTDVSRPLAFGAVAIVIGAVIVTASALLAPVGHVGGPHASVGSASPRPSSSPTPSVPNQTLSPQVGLAASFPRPFQYEIPLGADLVMSSVDPTWYQFRHPTGVPDTYDMAIAVRAVSGGRDDPCDSSSRPKTIDGPDAWIAYFESIPTVNVDDLGRTSVDGWPARTAELTFDTATTSCPDVWLWGEEGSITQNSGRSGARVTMVTVDGDQIAILVFGDASFQNLAAEFISSIRFESAHASPSGG
jgi:hypothetical protein